MKEDLRLIILIPIYAIWRDRWHEKLSSMDFKKKNIIK
jgi:hypothetical protein